MEKASQGHPLDFRVPDDCQLTEESKDIKICLCCAGVQPGFTICVNASNVGLGVVLCQADDSRNLHPVTLISRRFQPMERHLSAIERVCLLIVLTLQALHLGKEIHPLHQPFPFVVATDYEFQ